MVRQTNRKLAASKMRSSTPMCSVTTIKQSAGSSSGLKHQHLKEEHLKRQRRRRRLVPKVQKARRERWAQAAHETQRIVLGDGKYVEEKLSSTPVSCFIPPTHVSYPDNASPQVNPSHSHGQHTMTTKHVTHDISLQIILSKQGTTFFPHFLADWCKPPAVPPARTKSTSFSFVSGSTLTAARQLHERRPDLTRSSPYSLSTTSIGVLSFASPKRPGGGYLHGGNEQEETLARSSSLVASLLADQAKEFYTTHKKFLSVDGAGVVAFRQDDSDNASPLTTVSSNDFIPPYLINVLSAVPVNAAAIRQNYTITASTAHIFMDGIRDKMRDRMGRALRIFEARGDRALVLGAFGCGSSENKVEMVAEIWADLLVHGESEENREDGKTTVPRAAFKDSFEEVVFAVPGKLFEPFKKAFDMRVFEAEVSRAVSE
ncbi:uncharacterized protein F5147DRAFT_753240 [Suillus discolor]|uniref:Microbial-type PARG catalytic domain-containing protein n=1 Tax=Suillus discolor TaxID=1912936 RepID=A0A9P7F7W7_9AGAM|nr:uncharacterized protein F5147DRAFT_753240 [Suillus discolor]KAG2109350.1 hypothetical protein F5147DRAFT_753240 [Suillus discolor]